MHSWLSWHSASNGNAMHYAHSAYPCRNLGKYRGTPVYFRLHAFTGKATRWSLSAKVFFADALVALGLLIGIDGKWWYDPALPPKVSGGSWRGDHIVIVRGGDNSSKGIMPEDLLALEALGRTGADLVHVRQAIIRGRVRGRCRTGEATPASRARTIPFCRLASRFECAASSNPARRTRSRNLKKQRLASPGWSFRKAPAENRAILDQEFDSQFPGRVNSRSNPARPS